MRIATKKTIKKPANSFVDLSNPQRETAKALYERLKSTRDAYTKRAEDCAAMTIPALFPKESDTSSTSYQTPNQSVGARGVNNLSSKLQLALFPPNSTFFRLTPNEKVLAELAQREGTDDNLKQEIEQALMRIEHRIIRYIETRQLRVTIKEALNQLIVAGNCLLFLPPAEGGAKLYRLSNYCLERDALGNVIQIVTADSLAFATLSPELQAIVASDNQNHKPEEQVTIFTHIYLEGDTYASYQEMNGTVIPGSEQTYPYDKSPWIALRMVKVDGESYGRSFVEEYLGDLQNLDTQSEALRNYAAITSYVVYFVNPTGITQVRRLEKAKSGSFVPGRVEDVQPLQTNKTSDMSVTKAYVDGLEQRLSYVFLLNSAVQRNAERVTAEEIRYVAGELEDTLGGTYSILSQELQLPLVRRLMVQLEVANEIPSLPEGIVEPTITTGLEALGRGHDLNKLITFKDLIATVPGAENFIKMNNFILMAATSLGIDTTDLVKTQEELEAERQQALAEQIASQATPNVARGMMDAAAQQPIE